MDGVDGALVGRISQSAIGLTRWLVKRHPVRGAVEKVGRGCVVKAWSI